MTGLLRSKCCHECWPFNATGETCCYSTTSVVVVTWVVDGVAGSVVLRAWSTGTVGQWTVGSTTAYWTERPITDPLGPGAYAQIEFGPNYGWVFYHESGGSPIAFTSQTCCTASYSSGGDTYSLQLKNNRCEGGPDADLIVTGDVLCAGLYDLGGTHNGQDYYVRQGDSAYYIWYFPFGIYAISAALDDMTNAWTETSAPILYGDYSPSGTSTGTATVSLPPACQSTQEDQC